MQCIISVHNSRDALLSAHCHRRLDIPFGGVEVGRGDAALFKLASGSPMREFAGVRMGRAALSRLSVLIGNFVLCPSESK